jgi:hypothetical protein
LKLINLKLEPKGNNGLESEVLYFGDHITQLYGATGTGKTPLVKSISYCLGYPAVFRQEIYNRCSSAVLKFSIKNEEYSIRREIIRGKSFEAELTEPNSDVTNFYSERDFSDKIFFLLGLENRSLITNDGKKESPYISTVLPLFSVTQDKGYTKLYSSEGSFIKDQFSEMVRFVFGLPEKNSFHAKKGLQDDKKRLNKLDELVVERRKDLKLLKETLEVSDDRNTKEIEASINDFKLELQELLTISKFDSSSLRAFDRIIDKKKDQLKDSHRNLRAVRNRLIGVFEIRSELETEINTLSLNESARRVFSGSEEICSNPACGLFSRSSDSYSKNLMYLKDQVKDLQRTEDYDTKVEGQIVCILKEQESALAQLETERETLIQAPEVEQALSVINELKLSLFKLQSDLADVEKVEYAEKQFISLLNQRDEALSAYVSHSKGGKVDLRLTELRTKLRKSFISWLAELNTSNVSYDVSFRDDFEPVLGEETVRQLSGSTGSRTVLAFHAALFELIAPSHPFNVLILDAPKQHETENVDLVPYFSKLKKICAQYNVQVIFSATEYRYEGDERDKEWSPKYNLNGKMMFMKG